MRWGHIGRVAVEFPPRLPLSDGKAILTQSMVQAHGPREAQKTTPTTTVSAGAGCRTGGGSRCTPAVWGTHHFFYAEQDPHVQPGVWSGACSSATGQRTGGDRPPTHHAHNPPPQRRGKCTVLYFLHIVCFPSPFFRILHCPAELEPPLHFFTTPTTQGSRGVTEGNARHAAVDNTGVRMRLCTIRQRYASQCKWRSHRRRPNPPLRM